ncbi:MAG: ZIP family metal transporter [Mycoplasma sp.]|nr:ZIP family metal transporter [Mycoplasma sp.]
MTKVQILITVIASISAFVIGIPLIYGVLLPIFKPKISKRANKYLYAFSSGFFIMMSTVLFIGESKTHLEEQFTILVNNDTIAAKAITGSIIASVILLGLLFSLGIKYLFAKSFKGKAINTNNHDHDHDKLIFNLDDHNPRSKAFAIFFLLSHRIPDGLIIGMLASQIAREGVNVTNIVFLCSFVIHVIPEELIIYYRQIDMGINKTKATINSLIAICAIIPLIIIGSVISWFSWENEIAIHVIQLISASFLLFISVVEFIPEFIHDIKNNGKDWYITILIWIIGIAIGIFVLCFHDHSNHSHEHNIINEIITKIN